MHLANITTIHGFCATLCREFAFQCGISPQFSILGDSDRHYLIQSACRQFLARVPNALQEDATYYLSQFSESRFQTDILQCFQKEDYLDQYTSADIQTMTPLSKSVYKMFLSIKKQVETLKATSNSLDYHDLIALTQKLLTNKAIRQTIQQRYQYIMVDECQDTDPIQWSSFRYCVMIQTHYTLKSYLWLEMLNNAYTGLEALI